MRAAVELHKGNRTFTCVVHALFLAAARMVLCLRGRPIGNGAGWLLRQRYRLAGTRHLKNLRHVIAFAVIRRTCKPLRSRNDADQLRLLPKAARKCTQVSDLNWVAVVHFSFGPDILHGRF